MAGNRCLNVLCVIFLFATRAVAQDQEYSQLVPNIIAPRPDAPGANGTGSATFVFLGAPGAYCGLNYNVQLNFASDGIIAAHLHKGSLRTQFGPIMVYLYGPIRDPAVAPFSGVLASGTLGPVDLANPQNGIQIADFNELHQIMDDGLAYINIHTKAYPNGGALRSQVTSDETLPCPPGGLPAAAPAVAPSADATAPVLAPGPAAGTPAEAAPRNAASGQLGSWVSMWAFAAGAITAGYLAAL